MQISPGFVHILFPLDTICGFKWIRNSGKIYIKYVSVAIYF